MSVEYLVKAERIELVAESLYRRLASKFEQVPRFAQLVGRLADEERRHAQRVGLLRKQVMGDRELAATIPNDTSALDRLLTEAEMIAQHISTARFTVKDAIALMRRLEDNFSVAHAEIASSKADPSIKRFFEKMALQDKQHASLLKDLDAIERG